MKVIKNIIVTLSALFILWGFVSWLDIIDDNCKPNPQHYDWNMFVVMTEHLEADKG